MEYGFCDVENCPYDHCYTYEWDCGRDCWIWCEPEDEDNVDAHLFDGDNHILNIRIVDDRSSWTIPVNPRHSDAKNYGFAASVIFGDENLSEKFSVLTELNYSLAVPVELQHPGVLLHVVPPAVHLPPGLGRIRPLEEPERSLRQTQHGRQGEAVCITTVTGNRA